MDRRGKLRPCIAHRPGGFCPIGCNQTASMVAIVFNHAAVESDVENTETLPDHVRRTAPAT